MEEEGRMKMIVTSTVHLAYIVNVICFSSRSIYLFSDIVETTNGARTQTLHVQESISLQYKTYTRQTLWRVKCIWRTVSVNNRFFFRLFFSRNALEDVKTIQITIRAFSLVHEILFSIITKHTTCWWKRNCFLTSSSSYRTVYIRPVCTVQWKGEKVTCTTTK